MRGHNIYCGICSDIIIILMKRKSIKKESESFLKDEEGAWINPMVPIPVSPLYTPPYPQTNTSEVWAAG